MSQFTTCIHLVTLLVTSCAVVIARCSHESCSANGYNTTEHISLFKNRVPALTVNGCILEGIPHPRSQLVHSADLLKEAGNHRVLGKVLLLSS